MALLATRAELAVVRVVVAVAGAAVGADGRDVFPARCFTRVARLAGHLGVGAVQSIARALVVVEAPGLPVARGVAGVAARAEAQLVLVILAVAGVALGLRILEARREVAGLAVGDEVPAGEREACLRMVEVRHAPVQVGVALAALRAELAFVAVVLAVAGHAVGRGGAEDDARAAHLEVAGRAWNGGARMRVAQHEAGLVVVEAAGGCLPVLLGVAALALLAERALVAVILAVAADAVLRRLLEERALVAGLALRIGMAAEQREGGLAVVELRTLLPVALGVAARALAAERALVLVVLAVAGVTLACGFLPVERPGVAIRARQQAVLAAQGVAGLGVVVEEAALPRLGAVAALAALAELALVPALLVHTLVAADAGARRLAVLRVFVAAGAGRVGVLAGEREAGLVVVELRLFPGVFGVALVALGAEAALVGVVLAVAGQAVLRRLAVLLGGEVAGAARGLQVTAAQRVVGLRVVEVLAVELGQAHAAALVLGVAAAAGLGLLAAVEAGALAQVVAHVLMAAGAQAVLRVAVEAHVALLAVVVPFGVGVAELARRQHRLQALRPHRQCQGQQRREARGPGPCAPAHRGQYACTANTWNAALRINR